MYIFNFEKKFWLYIIKYVILSPSLPSQFAHLLGFCCYCSCIFTMLSFFFSVCFNVDSFHCYRFKFILLSQGVYCAKPIQWIFPCIVISSLEVPFGCFLNFLSLLQYFVQMLSCSVFLSF
jgi:hypothetical protein